MKLFISQPMKGRTDEEILKEREEILARCKQRYGDDIELIESFYDDEPGVKVPALAKLGRSIIALADADVAYFAKGFDKARGCCIENKCAIEYGIEVIEDYGKRY